MEGVRATAIKIQLLVRGKEAKGADYKSDV